jgi:hypothetical protein
MTFLSCTLTAAKLAIYLILSPEYYHGLFKGPKPDHSVLEVALVGFQGVNLLVIISSVVALILGFFVRSFCDYFQMTAIVVSTMIVTAIVGLGTGQFMISKAYIPDFLVREGLTDPVGFARAGLFNVAIYFGFYAGLLAAAILWLYKAFLRKI